jgi:hypothetical protein
MQTYQLGKRFTNAGVQLAGGKAYFRVSGTTTPADVYADSDLTEELAYPIVADAYGNFPELVYLDPTVTYRLTIIASTGSLASPLYAADPINADEGAGGIETADINDEAITAAKLADGAIEAKLGFTPQADLTDLTAAALNALLNRTGEVFLTMKSSAPTGALKMNGATIGSAASGSTNASALYSALFAIIWALDSTEFPILDSAGGASSRGASAAADFAANKRLTLKDMRGEFVRGWDDSRAVDTSRVLGSDQAGQLAAHTHTYATARGDIGSGGQDVTGITGTGQTTGSTGGTENSSENRPRNIAWLWCVWF